MCDCPYLARVVQALPDDTVHNGPGQNQVAKKIPLDSSDLVDASAHVQHFIA